MTIPYTIPRDPAAMARLAGVLYLAIIVLGIWSEVFVRATLIDPADPVATAGNILAGQCLFKGSLAADTIMALCDVALAVLLYVLLKPAGAVIALAAMVFRLVQAGLIAVSLLNQYAALAILNGTWPVAGDPAQLAPLYLNAHSHGYDLGLVFFAVNSMLTGLLVIRSGYFPKALGYLLVAAGAVYFTGSTLRFMAPHLLSSFEPAYVVCLIAELGFALWLLVRGVNIDRWRDANGPANSQ
ncbi:MAG: DUF4386 domain-containing protein [Nitratireductor sp.]|nr:DUF4386 domain-containing protein [Nitratireductor sp.]